MSFGLRRHTLGSRSSVEADRPDTTADDETVVDADQGNGMRLADNTEAQTEERLNFEMQFYHTSSASCDLAPTSAE